VGDEASAHTVDGEDPGIRIGDLMVVKFKNLTGWYECKVVGAGEGGKWVVEWEDGSDAAQDRTCTARAVVRSGHRTTARAVKKN
jgi:hypothetical protein